MTLTPIVADTATASATMATAVRLRDAPTPATASLALVPPILDAAGALHRDRQPRRHQDASATSDTHEVDEGTERSH